jgi:hypothetical protein
MAVPRSVVVHEASMATMAAAAKIFFMSDFLPLDVRIFAS